MGKEGLYKSSKFQGLPKTCGLFIFCDLMSLCLGWNVSSCISLSLTEPSARVEMSKFPGYLWLHRSMYVYVCITKLDVISEWGDT